jgi:hypothetical protein
MEVMGHDPVYDPLALSADAQRDTIPLWDAASGRFQPVRLRAAIVARGWAVREFAAASAVSPACLYNALRGLAVSDRTVVRVLTTLASRSPVSLVASGSEEWRYEGREPTSSASR